MRLLLDTHAFIWFATGDKNLPASAVALIVDSRNSVVVSAASCWEMAIKTALGRADFAVMGQTEATFTAWFRKQRSLGWFDELPITLAHAARLVEMPFHHRDPFDRLLLAQASVEELTLVSRDEHFAAYGVPVVW